MNSVLLEMAVFADAPVDLTITSKAKIKNSSAAIHHIISYQRILCRAVVFAGRVFDLLYDTDDDGRALRRHNSFRNQSHLLRLSVRV